MTARHSGIHGALILAVCGLAIANPVPGSAGEPTPSQQQSGAGAPASGSSQGAGHAETTESTDAAYGTGFDTEPLERTPPVAEPSRAALDERVERNVRELLTNEPDVDVHDLRVEVQNGIVTLYGRVGSGPDKHLASTYSGSVRGAEGVVNMIEVVPGLEKGVEVIPPPRVED